MVQIRPLNNQDTNRLSELHLKYFRSNFKNLPGKKMLDYYYRCVSEQIGSTGYVARVNDQVAGYICGVWDKKVLNRSLIKKYGIQLAFWGVIHAITHPSHIIRFVSKVRRGNKLAKKSGYELRPIIVDAHFRGTGIANDLVERLLIDAKERGYRHMFLFTEEDNHRARNFYEKINFSLVETFISDSQQYCLYEIAL